MDYEVFKLGDVKLLSGVILRSAKLAYKTYGTLNACLLYTSPSPRDRSLPRMPSSA